uniref:Uncharacterized protein n=1 Tax=Aegilops tauschii subsp. strangulata TaxID=200361 RepID=A0A453GTE9_AEGTS
HVVASITLACLASPPALRMAGYYNGGRTMSYSNNDECFDGGRTMYSNTTDVECFEDSGRHGHGGGGRTM